jgi:hypothetical protein
MKNQAKQFSLQADMLAFFCRNVNVDDNQLVRIKLMDKDAAIVVDANGRSIGVRLEQLIALPAHFYN